jgi:acetyl-CoA carboxylase biotin carboxylase subunit
MFNKVLIANRGEIAVRIIRACRELGLTTVAVYSDADREGLHVRLADEAYYLGPSPARDSYLRADKIIAIAKKSKSGAVHPGYGFLAERADFAQACLDEKLAFIGPKPSSIAAMGDKGVARSKVISSGVPVVPGTEGEGSLRDDELLTTAGDIGFPLLIKATAGGGGKGMREVQTIDEMPELLQAARQEAEASFGDGNVYLGNVIHLGERECSLQRRHQKLLEESPSPFIGDDDELRQKMGSVAVRAAQAVDYVNAGTIEFLVDKDKNFFFLEMNTRLQVEHPITELVTGFDIVKEQIRVARGRQLRHTQEDITLSGWALECRINAEDPYNSYLPSTGRITHMIQPSGPGVRLDTGVYPGFSISPYYDSLIAKLIVSGETRGEALLRMRRALEEFKIIGIRTNIPFHQRMMYSTSFMAGQYDTRFVEERFSMETSQDIKGDMTEVAAILATLVAHQQTQRAAHIIQRNERDTSNWKWVGRWERMQR